MFSKSEINKSYSLWAITIIFITLICISFSFNLWKQDRIKVDAPSYYTYLPAVFVYGNLHLNFIETNREFFKDKIWCYKIENNNRLIKHPIGFSVLLSPFFLIGHWMAGLTGSSQDGYSMSYQNAVTVGIWIYLFIGLFYLRKVLLFYFSEAITALTLIAIVLGTNLLWYSTFEGLMPHAISFSILCLCIYFFFSWLKFEKKKHLLLFSIFFGLSVLIRPLAITTIFYFFLFAIISKGGFKNFINFIKPQIRIILICLPIFFSIIFIQLLYWKYATGQWYYDVYIDEHFVFNSPQILPFLFSFRKGMFVYTPILLFSIIGLLRFYKNNKAIFYSTLLVMCISIYILSSWWAWSYGICWAMRPMIDYYSFLSIPIAAGFTAFSNRGKVFSFIRNILIGLFILLNLFQTWQYKNGLIHYDDMTREAYFKGFFQTKPNLEWYDCLKPYNWQRRIKGLPQIEYSQEFINSIPENKAIYLRGSNMMYASASKQTDFILTSLAKTITPDEHFYIHRIASDTVALKASNGKYLSLKPLEHDIIVADADEIKQTEKFVLTVTEASDNKIHLQAGNKNFVTVFNKFPFFVQGTASEASNTEQFRIYVSEDYQSH